MFPHLTFKSYVIICLLSGVLLILFTLSVTRPADTADAFSMGGRDLAAGAPGTPGSARRAFVVDTPGCKIPNIDPFDVTVRHLVVADNLTVRCNATPPMTSVK